MGTARFVAAFLLVANTAARSENISLCRRGWVATESGEYSAAVELFNQCIKEGDLTAASLARTHRNIGIAYRRAKQPSKAIKAYSMAIALKPADVWDDYINRGNAYDESNDLTNALLDYSRALAIKPDYGEAFYNRGIAYEHNNKLGQAKSDFKHAYDVGLRTDALYERLQVYGLLQKNP